MKWLTWEAGRQKSGYDKLLIASSKFLRFDCYLLRMPTGCEIPRHRDPVKAGFSHHRLNITLKKPCIGSGVVTVEGPAKTLGERVMLFRPDLYFHSMNAVDFIWSDESMYMLSIGWLTREKAKEPAPVG